MYFLSALLFTVYTSYAFASGEGHKNHNCVKNEVKNEMCHGKPDGNYYIPGDSEYHEFLQCSNGLAYCQPCWPGSLYFNQECNQCLYNYNDKCHTTQYWVPEPTYPCPDLCGTYGPKYSGNIYDPQNYHHYIACWHGVTVACMNCPKGTLFNYDHNACLWEGKYWTKPTGGN